MMNITALQVVSFGKKGPNASTYAQAILNDEIPRRQKGGVDAWESVKRQLTAEQYRLLHGDRMGRKDSRE